MQQVKASDLPPNSCAVLWLGWVDDIISLSDLVAAGKLYNPLRSPVRDVQFDSIQDISITKTQSFISLNLRSGALVMQFKVLLVATLGLLSWAAPLSAPITPNTLENRVADDNDEYVVYPDVDRDEDVVYAYHAINDK
ncbi:hypothetical protein ACMFMG_012151 [Clarireedia jacksonii]